MDIGIGTKLAERYRLAELIGKGGMGQVWRAHDERLDRDVAVKVLPREMAEDPDARRRFIREATLPARMQHPGITVVHDAGFHDDQMFIVTELLRGRDLGKLLSQCGGRLPTGRVVSLGIELADALTAAHAHGDGVVHRDLKPQNLFVQDEGPLKILDFGLAKAASPDDTVTTIVAGTPGYMSPEQLAGARPHAAMDMYATGCVLYKMLTGSLPFPRPDPIPSGGHLTEGTQPPRDSSTGVPGPLNDLVLALLAEEPAGRPGAARVARELRAIRDAIEDAARKADKEAAVAAARAEARADAAASAQALIDAAERKAASAAAAVRDATAAAEAGSVPSRPAAVACASPGPGLLEVFIQDGTSALQHRARHAAAWTAREGLATPGGRLAAIAVGSHRARPARSVAAIASGVPYLKYWWRHADAWLCWAQWAEVGGTGAAAPSGVTDIALSCPAGDQADLFALDAAGRICHRRLQPAKGPARAAASPWLEIPGRPATAIAAVSHNDNCQTLVAVIDGSVQMKAWPYKDGWTRWQPLGLAGVTSVACSSSGPGRLDFFALSQDGTLWHITGAGARGSSGWASLLAPGDPVTAIAATSARGEDPTLVALTATGIVHCARIIPNSTENALWSPLPPQLSI
jgi:hypothetical protein